MFYKVHQGVQLDSQTVENLRSRKWIESNAIRVYKNKVNIVAELKLKVNGEDKHVVVKYFGWRNTVSFILSPFMRSRAQKTFDHSLLLLANGIRVPAPIAVYTFRRFGFIGENFIVMEKIMDYRLAREVIRDDNESLERKKTIVREIGRIIRKIHEINYVHNDLTLGNFLVDADHNVYLIDLNRMKKKFFLSWQRKMYELAKLNLCSCDLAYSHKDCLYVELLEEYSGDKSKKLYELMRKAIRKNRLRRKAKKLLRWRKKV